MNWDRWKKRLQKNLSVILISFIFFVLPFVLPYTALATEILIFSMAAMAFDLLLGYTGIMIFCQASFFGTGGYITGLLIQHFQPNIFVIIVVAILGTALLGLFFGYMSTQRTGAYCVLLTLAFNELIFFIAYQWQTLTGGSDGLGKIPRPRLEIPGLLDVNLFPEVNFYFFAMFFVILSFIAIRSITESPFGRVLKGIRENETRAQAIGFNTRLFKIISFIISASFMGFAGSLYAMFVNFVDISYVGLDTSGKILMMQLIGGMGTLYGPILGAALVSLASDIACAYWDRWQIILGAIFIFFVLFARGGIWGMIIRLNERGRNYGDSA